MAIVKGVSFADEAENPTSGEVAIDLSMQVSRTIYDRMHELGMSKSELARAMGKKPSQITRMLSGQANMTLATVAQIYTAIGLRPSVASAPLSIDSVADAKKVSTERGTRWDRPNTTPPVPKTTIEVM